MFEGILCIDKPAGVTSHDVVGHVRRAAKMRKVGHGGTLDPLATGLLIVALGRATRLLEYVLGQPKTYEALVRLGQTSNTYDGEGELVESGPVEATKDDILEVLAQFRGDIWQTPPMFSAIKREGKPLYELARQGLAVAREARRVTIYELELLSYDKPDIALCVSCSSGTYIRSLAHDIGQALGAGAHLAALRRTSIGDFTVEDATPLHDLTPERLPGLLLEMDSAVVHLPEQTFSHEDALHLSQGKRVAANEIVEPTPALWRAYDEAGAFVGIVSLEGGSWQAQKILYAPPATNH